MSRLIEREKSLELRKQGMSYSQIKAILGVSKSTLSIWLKDHPLSPERIVELRDRNEQKIEKFRETMRFKRETRLENVYQLARQNISTLTDREFLMAGLGLYWGEGTKVGTSMVAVTNTDPSVHKFFISWLKKIHKISIDDLRVSIQLYSDMNPKEEIQYWSKTLHIPESQFNKPYIKNSSSSRISHKGFFGHGTCRVAVFRTYLKEQISMQLKALLECSNN